MKKAFFWLACFLVVVIIFHICYGLRTLLPGNVSWLMTVMHDWGTHYMGWLFYRNEPWQFPIGDMDRYFYPVGTNVGFTDSIPLLAIFFKLFSGILPADFQYFGIWLFLCHLLAAYYTVLLCRLFNINIFITFIAVVFIAANPVLIYRGLHPALSAHWLLIASLYVYFLDPSLVKPVRIFRYQFILLLISALVNPYLCFMVLGFSIITAVKICFFEKAISRKIWIAYTTGSCLALLLCWYIVGMMKFGEKTDLGVQGGYGLYGLNLNSFYNPFGFSTVLPQLKWVSPHQYEGFMYLGLGIFLLIFILLLYGGVLLVKKIINREGFRRKLSFNNTSLIPLLILVILYTLFAISHVVSLNEKVLFRVPIPKFIISFGEIFRASARFFWPVYYLLLFLVIIGIARLPVKSIVKIAILAVALALQLYDTKPIFVYRHLNYGAYEPPVDKNWNTLLTHFDRVIFFPPFQATNLSFMDYQYFCYLAGKAQKPINTGYVARLDGKAMNAHYDSLMSQLQEARLSPGSLYISTPANLRYFSFALQTGACNLNYLDGYYYLFSAGKADNSLLTLTSRLNSLYKEKIDSGLNITGHKTEFIKLADTSMLQAGSVRHFVERFSEKEKSVSLSGWAFNDTTSNNQRDSVFIILKGESAVYIAATTMQSRPDVTSHFQKQFLDNAGFESIIFKDNLDKGTYTLGIAIKDSKGRIIYTGTDKTVKAGITEYAPVEKINNLPVTSDIVFNAETVATDDKQVSLSGWAYLKDIDADSSNIAVVLKNEDNIYLVWTNPVTRPDVTQYFHNGHDLNRAGFTVKIARASLPKGNLRIGILITNNKHKKQSVIFTGKEIDL